MTTLEVFGRKLTGWKATVAFYAVWLSPGLLGYLIGRLH
jgi:hypothetical protein